VLISVYRGRIASIYWIDDEDGSLVHTFASSVLAQLKSGDTGHLRAPFRRVE